MGGQFAFGSVGFQVDEFVGGEYDEFLGLAACLGRPSAAASRGRGAQPASSPVARVGKPSARPATAVRVPIAAPAPASASDVVTATPRSRIYPGWRSGRPGEHSGGVDGDGGGTPHGLASGGRRCPAASQVTAAAVGDPTYEFGACTQSSTACTYVLSPSGVPIPTATYTQNVMNFYVLPNAQSEQNTAQAVFTPEGAYPVTGIKGLPLTISAEQGKTILVNTIETLEPGHSRGHSGHDFRLLAECGHQFPAAAGPDRPDDDRAASWA